jgi:hypothetical protein
VESRLTLLNNRQSPSSAGSLQAVETPESITTPSSDSFLPNYNTHHHAQLDSVAPEHTHTNTLDTAPLISSQDTSNPQIVSRQYPIQTQTEISKIQIGCSMYFEITWPDLLHISQFSHRWMLKLSQPRYRVTVKLLSLFPHITIRCIRLP